MTPDVFRNLVRALPKTQERGILGAQEFRLRDKVFATLGWPEAGWAVVKLSPEQQRRFLQSCAGLSPEPGGRGKRGITRIRLAVQTESSLGPILQAAWLQAGGTAGGGSAVVTV